MIHAASQFTYTGVTQKQKITAAATPHTQEVRQWWNVLGMAYIPVLHVIHIS